MKRIKVNYVIIVMPALLFCFYGLSLDNEVLQDSMYPCCDDGYCVNSNCSTISGMHIKPEPECINYNFSCRTCVDFSVSHCLCYTGSYRCKENDGSYYYGQQVSCDVQSKFP